MWPDLVLMTVSHVCVCMLCVLVYSLIFYLTHFILCLFTLLVNCSGSGSVCECSLWGCD